MDTEKYYTLAKTALLIPFIAGLLTLAEQFLPLQKMDTVAVYKHQSRSAKLGNTTYSIDFTNNNDQFTETIYNKVNEGDEVTLQVLYFTKEVQNIQLRIPCSSSSQKKAIKFIPPRNKPKFVTGWRKAWNSNLRS